jgi:prepilin-type N-terminal cleavage/methylation domain-containing protein
VKNDLEKVKALRRHRQAGFSLLEVMVSLAIFLVLFLGTVTAIIGSTYLSSFVKHKVQAMYWAQRFVEEQRRVPFANLASIPSTCVAIDTWGTFVACPDPAHPTGNRIVTVTTIDAYRKRVKIEMNWQEKILKGLITLQEYYSTDIANESQLN